MRADLALPGHGDIELGLRGRLVTGRPGEEVIDDGTVVMAGGNIVWCGPTADLPESVDADLRQVPLILPGLVDVHCHGALGHTFSADADGVHLDPEIVRMVFGLVGPRSIALITDAMAAAGMSDGRYTLGSLDVLVQDRVARLVPAEDDAHPGAIAGATSLLLENVRHCVEWGVPLADAVTAASATPARLMGLDQPGSTQIGSVTEGYRADVLVTTEKLELLQAYRAGTPLTQERNARADYSL